MVNVYLDEVKMLSQPRDLDRTLSRRAQRQAALAGQPLHPSWRFTLVNKGVVRIGTRLIVWGHRLQQAQAPATPDYAPDTGQAPDTAPGCVQLERTLRLRTLIAFPSTACKQQHAAHAMEWYVHEDDGTRSTRDEPA